MRENDEVWFLIYTLLAAVTALVSWQYEAFSNWLLQWGEVIGFLVTGFLTVGLVVLYNQQKKLEESKYEPVVWLEGYYTSKTSYETGDLFMILSNVGNGTALNLRVRTEVEFPQHDSPPVLILPTTTELNHLQEDLEDVIVSEQSYLYPDSLKEHFRANPLIQMKIKDTIVGSVVSLDGAAATALLP